MDYPWYQDINGSDGLQQGDFIPECPIIIPPENMEVDGSYEVEVQLIDSIVLSQSCDLEHGKIDIVLVCPYLSLKNFLSGLPPQQTSGKGTEKIIKGLKDGSLQGYHLLKKSEENRISDYQVVDFRNVYGIHINSLKQKVLVLNPRIRLLPPYREHLSQAFARYFMRVGLPQDFKVDGY